MSRHGENIRKRKDGRWEGRFIKNRDESGKAKYGSIYAKSYIEVKRRLTEINAQIQKNNFIEKDINISFQNILFLWLERNRIKLRNQTYSKYKSMIENHIIPSLGNINVNQLNSIKINDFLLRQSVSGRIDGKGGLSPSYIKTLIFIINSSVTFAHTEGYRTPLSGEIIKPQKKIEKLEVLSVAEQAILELYLLNQNDDRAFGILLSLYSGLRLGEVCGLHWNDIDLQNKTIHINHTVSRVSTENSSPKTKLILGDPKTFSSNRIIPISSRIYSCMIERKRMNCFVVPGNLYPYIDPRTFQNYFHKCLKACGINDINYHALRHTFATRCIESGMDVKSLSEILGHSNVNITLNTYVHSSLENKRRQLDEMAVYCGQ